MIRTHTIFCALSEVDRLLENGDQAAVEAALIRARRAMTFLAYPDRVSSSGMPVLPIAVDPVGGPLYREFLRVLARVRCGDRQSALQRLRRLEGRFESLYFRDLQWELEADERWA